MNKNAFIWLLVIALIVVTADEYLTATEGDFIFFLPSVLYLIALIPVFHIRAETKLFGIIGGIALMHSSTSIFNFSIKQLDIYYLGLIVLLFGIYVIWRFGIREISGQTSRNILKALILANFISSFVWFVIILDDQYSLGLTFLESTWPFFYWCLRIGQILIILYAIILSVKKANRITALLILVTLALVALREYIQYQINAVNEWRSGTECTSCDLFPELMNLMSYAFSIYLTGYTIIFLFIKAAPETFKLNFSIIIIGGATLFFISNEKITDLQYRLSKQIAETELYREQSEYEAVNARESEANALRFFYDFRDFSRGLVANPISDFEIFRAIKDGNNFKLIKKSKRKINSIQEAILMINAEYNWTPSIERWYGWDSVRLTLEKPYSFDSLEKKIYQAKIVLALTEIEKIKYVEILDEGYTRIDFEDKLIK